MCDECHGRPAAVDVIERGAPLYAPSPSPARTTTATLTGPTLYRTQALPNAPGPCKTALLFSRDPPQEGYLRRKPNFGTDTRTAKHGVTCPRPIVAPACAEIDAQPDHRGRLMDKDGHSGRHPALLRTQVWRHGELRSFAHDCVTVFLLLAVAATPACTGDRPVAVSLDGKSICVDRRYLLDVPGWIASIKGIGSEQFPVVSHIPPSEVLAAVPSYAADTHLINGARRHTSLTVLVSNANSVGGLSQAQKRLLEITAAPGVEYVEEPGTRFMRVRHCDDSDVLEPRAAQAIG